MAKVITLSRTFPSYHPKSEQPTYFVQQVLNALGIEYFSEQFRNELCRLNHDKILGGKLARTQVFDFWEGLRFVGDHCQKLHTIRAKTVKKTGEVVSRWKAGDKASLRVWSGVPYYSPQIIIAPDVELVKVGEFRIDLDLDMNPWIDLGTKYFCPPPLDLERSIISEVAKNDGLTTQDLLDWFEYPKPFEGQVLCWKGVSYV